MKAFNEKSVLAFPSTLLNSIIPDGLPTCVFGGVHRGLSYNRSRAPWGVTKVLLQDRLRTDWCGLANTGSL